jgi:predicted HicB family RNase H-like nuclease
MAEAGTLHPTAGSPVAPQRVRALAGPRAARTTATAVRFDPLLPFDTWQELGARIGRHSSGAAWWLGDWLVFGRMKYGRRYKDAVEATGFDYQTLRNYAVVARRFPPSRRRDDLSFQHHAEVCALPDFEQDLWLDAAVAHRWSRNQLRRFLRWYRAPGDTPESSGLLRLTLDGADADRWREAAERTGVALAAWARQALNEAASFRPAPAELDGRR